MKDKEFSGGGREFSSPGQEFSDSGRELTHQPPEMDRSGREFRQESAPAKPPKKKRRRLQPAMLTAAAAVTAAVVLTFSPPAPPLPPASAPTPEYTAEPTPVPPDEEDPSAYINLTRSDDDDFSVYEPITLYYGMGGEYVAGLDLNGYHILSHETLLTVTNLANAEDNCYITISLNRCDKDQDGRYVNADEIYSLVLTNGGGFVTNLIDLSGYGGPVELRPGESTTVSLSEYDENDLLVLRAELYYPDLDQYWWKGYGFVIDDEAAARLRQE